MKSLSQLSLLIGTGFIMFVPFVVHAKVIDLVCTNAGGSSINFEIDTSRNLVSSRGMQARDVSIDGDSISFVIDSSGYEYAHVINRTTGILNITDPGGGGRLVFQCEVANAKF